MRVRDVSKFANADLSHYFGTSPHDLWRVGLIVHEDLKTQFLKIFLIMVSFLKIAVQSYARGGCNGATV